MGNRFSYNNSNNRICRQAQCTVHMHFLTYMKSTFYEINMCVCERGRKQQMK